MPFVDNLAVELITLVMVGGIVSYLSGIVYLEYRKNGTKNVEETLRHGIFPLGFLGGVITVLGIWGEIVWPLPGAYNIVFADPYLILGILLISMSLAIAFRQKLQVVGFASLLGGIMAIYYGAIIYSDGLTQSPLGAFGLYAAFGLAGIFTFPATIAYDTMDERKGKPASLWGIFLVLFWLFFIFAAVLAAVTGIPAVAAHIANPP